MITKDNKWPSPQPKSKIRIILRFALDDDFEEDFDFEGDRRISDNNVSSASLRNGTLFAIPKYASVCSFVTQEELDVVDDELADSFVFELGYAVELSPPLWLPPKCPPELANVVIFEHDGVVELSPPL